MPKKYNKHNILPWIEKYRPRVLDKIISQDKIINTLKIFIKKKCLPHLLFYGLSGTGKTSTIMACAHEMYGEYFDYMVMELNASDDRGIEVVRNKIKQFVSADSVIIGKHRNKFKTPFNWLILMLLKLRLPLRCFSNVSFAVIWLSP